MKYYGLFRVTYDICKKDKRDVIIKMLHSWFVEKSPLEIPFVKADKVDTDKAWLQGKKADFNLAERKDEKYSRGPHRYKSVWFIHECEVNGFWKMTKGEQKEVSEYERRQ